MSESTATRHAAGSPVPELAAYERRMRRPSVLAHGEPMIWATAGATVVAVLMILLLLTFIGWQGLTTFWPTSLVEVRTHDGKTILGEPSRHERFTPEGADASVRRVLYKTGNYDLTGTDFTWITDTTVASTNLPRWGLVVERVAWGNAYGTLEKVILDGTSYDGAEAAWAKFQEVHEPMRALAEKLRKIESREIGDISREQDDIRLELRGMEMEHGAKSAAYESRERSLKPRLDSLSRQMAELREDAAKLRSELAKARVIVRTPQGTIIPADRAQPEEGLMVAQVVRAYPANQLTTLGKTSVYFSRWSEYLWDEPREANMEGGVFPAIIGTVLMTFLMILIAVPVGVVAAVYLREYARQGLVVSIVRIAVNNLAGVPSIVFGVFGLGFFCYLIGGSIDAAFFPERLPDPTVGKTAMMWASLTLALLTLPVVIVATEEALAAVPRSLRESSYGCGATKWQTIWRVVLPAAYPGIMTGMILAIARGAGEVAPLMLVGAVKLAPDLPISPEGPFFGADRSFMHLGFHIYDLGFQSRNSEAARSMVYTTTLLLIAIVISLNVVAMWIRARLRRQLRDGTF